MSGKGQAGIISFDTIHTEHEECCCFEGCYRVPPGEWKVFWFNNSEPNGRERINIDARFSSGILGANVEYSDERVLTKAIVKRDLGKLIGVSTWTEVRGPDSLEMK